jgi:cell wall-associated NlpC family hydrolase
MQKDNINIRANHLLISDTLLVLFAFIDTDQHICTGVNILDLSYLVRKQLEISNFVNTTLFFNNCKLYFCLSAYVSGMICEVCRDFTKPNMVKLLIPAFLIVFALTSCSSLKPLNSAGSNQAASRQVNMTNAPASSNTPRQIKFLDDISANGSAENKRDAGMVVKNKSNSEDAAETKTYTNNYSGRSLSVEKASALQLKYAVLLNTEVEMLADDRLLEHVDEWYGTRYKMGGTTKKGIDCSAFVQAVYLSAFAITLPRTAHDQYHSAKIISATELKEGDLVFFNTRGGISHVGIYLQNNKFIHASTSFGVTVSDMFDPYYMKHFIGAGRINKPSAQNE